MVKPRVLKMPRLRRKRGGGRGEKRERNLVEVFIVSDGVAVLFARRKIEKIISVKILSWACLGSDRFKGLVVMNV